MNAIGVSWSMPVDVSRIGSPAEMFELFRSQDHLRHESEGRQQNIARQLFTFVRDIRVGDWVLAPLKSDIWIGEISSDYEFNPELFPIGRHPLGHPHTRRVRWLAQADRHDFSAAARKTLALPPTIIQADPHTSEVAHFIPNTPPVISLEQ
jgi:predicted Mrr-cat superfamily restriction endonuclease